jgi:hypothetical protein
MALPVPQFYTSGPQNCDKINLLFKSTQFVLLYHRSSRKQIQAPGEFPEITRFSLLFLFTFFCCEIQ